MHHGKSQHVKTSNHTVPRTVYIGNSDQGQLGREGSYNDKILGELKTLAKKNGGKYEIMIIQERTWQIAWTVSAHA